MTGDAPELLAPPVPVHGAGPTHLALTDGHLLEPRAEVPVLPGSPSGDAYPSAVVVAPDGRFVWTATRGQDVISVLAVTPEETDGPGLRLVTTVDCGGHWPRDLAPHPSGRFLYAANERSGDVTWFSVDPDSGIPRRGGSIEVSPGGVLRGVRLSPGALWHQHPRMRRPRHPGDRGTGPSHR